MPCNTFPLSFPELRRSLGKEGGEADGLRPLSAAPAVFATPAVALRRGPQKVKRQTLFA